MIKSDCWVPRADFLSTTLFVNFQTGCRMTKYALCERAKRKKNIVARKKIDLIVCVQNYCYLCRVGTI